jgi:integration host factor subunit alpha
MAKSITKNVLIENLVNKEKLDMYQAKAFVNDFFEYMSSVIETPEELNLSGFGSFLVRSKNQRPGRNPKTGQAYEIDSRNVVSFKMGSSLREKLIFTESK